MNYYNLFKHIKKLFNIVFLLVFFNNSAFTQSFLFDSTDLPFTSKELEWGFGKNTNPIVAQSYIINELDTVIFDINAGTFNSDYFEFPVSISSDDSVLSLDFSFQFNSTNYVFDTIYPLISQLQYLSHFNQSDLKLRFTSNSFSLYPQQSSVINIGFRVLDFSFCEINLLNTLAYLNGEPCAIKITDCPFPTSNMENLDGTKSIFPNPVSDELYVVQPANSIIQVYNTTGRLVFETFNSQRKTQLRLTDLQNGIYFLYIKNINSLSVNKIEVLH
jgi:hypothetical protein